MLINLRNALMAGRRLPYDAEVEYLESTGTPPLGKQWIDTGVAYDAANTYDMSFRCNIVEGLNGGFNYIAGWGAGGAFGGGYNSGWTDGIAGSGGGSCADITDVHLIINAGSNGSTVTTFTPGKTSTRAPHSALPNYANGTYPLFACYIPTLRLCSNVRFYMACMAVNGVLVRDFIPVRKGTVGYLYDRVSGKLFGNAGTGDFVVGQDVVPVEYIESHGTEWIDTGVVVSDMDYSISLDVMPTASTQGVLIGIENTINGYPGVLVNDIGTFRYGTQQAQSISPRLVANTKYSCVLSYKQLVVDGTSFSATGTTLNTPLAHSLYLFARNNVGTAGNQSECKIYKLTISDGMNILRDMMPIRIGSNSTWEGAMMDVLTRRIYRNDGTGAFTYGNDLKYPIPAS